MPRTARVAVGDYCYYVIDRDKSPFVPFYP